MTTHITATYLAADGYNRSITIVAHEHPTIPDAKQINITNEALQDLVELINHRTREELVRLVITEAGQHLTNIGQDYCREQLEKRFGLYDYNPIPDQANAKNC